MPGFLAEAGHVDAVIHALTHVDDGVERPVLRRDVVELHARVERTVTAVADECAGHGVRGGFRNQFRRQRRGGEVICRNVRFCHHARVDRQVIHLRLANAEDIAVRVALGADEQRAVIAIRRRFGFGDEQTVRIDAVACAVLDDGKVEFFDVHGMPVEKEMLVADFDMEAAEKGGYAHFMLKEIHEQPTAIKTTITPRIVDGMPNLEECGLTYDRLKGYNNIFVVACGTAMHAGLVGKYVLEKIGRIPVTVDMASEFRYRDPIIAKGDLVILVSQSGETADTLAALRMAKERGAETLSIVNVKGSSIARESDMVLYTHAGPEISVASTKAYIVQLSVFYLLSFAIAYAHGAISKEECMRLTAELQNVPNMLEVVLKTPDNCQYVASQLVNKENLLYIGRGLDYALSMEGSLKLKEISYIHSESYAAGELKHGTISLVTNNMPVIAVATQRELLDKTISNVKEVKARGAYVVLVTHGYINVDDEVADYKIGLPTIDDLLMPMLTVVPLQLIAYYTSVLRGNDVDKPRNLAKSVTVE